MAHPPPSLVRLERSPLTRVVARVLILTLLSWSLPFDAALPPRAAATEGVPGPPAGAVTGLLPGTLYVNANASVACNGKTPCFTTIQGAIDAVGPGQRVEIQAGTYVEQLEIQRKNQGARATEADRIVIEADPAAPPDSVLLRGRAERCEAGYAIEVARSKYVTIRGLTIVGAGGRGIGLRGGSLESTGVHLERNRVGRGGPRECNGGIEVGRGNPETVIANNLIYGNGRNGIRFRDGRGGSYAVVGNTIARNAWSGIQIAHASVVELVNNVVVANGAAEGPPSTRVGIRRLKTNPSPASQVRLRGNLVCGNVGGELAGPLLDATDAGNWTPSGTEGPGVAARAGCGDLGVLFVDANGADDVADTSDDDFHLATGSPAVDAGIDPRALGLPAARAVLEADHDAPGARPRDGDGDEAAEFDAGAHESPGGVQPSPTPTRTSTSTPGPTPTPSAAPTPLPTDAPTATPAPSPEPTASAAPTSGPTAAPTASPEPTAEPTPTSPPEPCLQCAACDTGLAGICSAGRTFCDGPFAEPECRTTTEPRTESCGNRVDEDCDGEVDEGGLPEQLPTTPAQTGVFVEPLGTTIKFFNQGSAIGLAQGDFNQDGVVDIATAEDANVQNGRRVSVIFGNGDGTFSEPTYLALPPQHVIPQAVLAHDFDRDGPLDLLVAMPEVEQVYFYRGDGQGGFAAPVPSGMGGRGAQIQTADLNCDGILDLATIVDATHVTVGFGNGDGTFAPTTSYLFNNNLVDLALTDVNGDGHPDLVTGSHEFAPLTGIGVRLNDGAGQFGDLKHTPGYSQPDRFGNRGHTQVFGIQIADFDGDTVPDAVASTQGPTGCFMFMKGNGDGTFTPPDYFDGLAERDPGWTCAGSGNLMRRYTENVAPDVDADGKPDVLFYWDENRVLVGISRGDGTFEARAFAASAGSGFPGSQTYQRADGSGMLAAIVADLNGDCMLDLVTNHRQTNGAHGRQGVLLARAPGDFHAPRIAPLLRDPVGDNGHQTERGVVTGDFNNDGNPDFAAGVGRAFFTVGGAGIGIDVWKGHGDGRGEALPITLNNFAGTGASFLRTADFDQDGFLDFVFQGGDGPFGARQSVSTVFGQGDFTFVDRQVAYSPRLDANEVNIRNMITTDLDGDEDPDVVALYDNGGFTKWFATFSNTGTRAPLQFVQEVEVGQGSNGRGIVAADFDGDDIPDIVAQDSGFADPQRVRLFKGNGDLTFAPGVTIWDWTAQGAAAAEDFAAADLDQDGDQDLVMAQYYHACAYVLLGHDDGTFDAPVCYSFWTSRTNRLAIEDFDVDGALDIVAGVEDGGLMFLRGRGDGTFDTAQMYAVGRANTEAVNVADFDRDGRPDLLWSYNDGNFGHSIVLSNATGAIPTPTPAPTATLPPGVTHTPQPTPTPTPTPRPTGTPPEGLASIVVEPVDQIMLAGATQQFTATGVLDDGTSVDLTGGVAWSSSAPAVASMSGTGTATGVAGGTTTITAAIGAVSGSTTLSVGARVPGDASPPVAEITSPAANAEVTAPVDVVGTATDALFLKYELEIAPVGETTFTLLKRGNAPVASGVLGQLDPTLLVNDLYTLRLTVFDRGGNSTVAESVVQVADKMKIGEFTLSFTDVSVPSSGLPLGVTRSYDSRDKRTGDFGVGWRMDIQSIRVRTNRTLGTGWVRTNAGVSVLLTATDEHKVSVTMPDGVVEEFDLQLSPTSNLFSLDQTVVTGFAPRPGTVGRLEALANPNLLILNAGLQDELVDDLTFATYDPQLFRYKLPDGTAIEVHRTDGVRKIVDPNGNTLTFDASGIAHSTGGSLVLDRDSAGRITRIVDPAGRSNLYAYDANGDLVAHTDPGGAVTTFAYDRRHNLIRMVDPLGRPVTRTEYDASGRLLRAVDAAGNTTAFDHDVPGRTERIRDRLGRISTLVYDERGNVLSVTDPLGSTRTFTYDANGNRLTSTDPLGRTSLYAYDAGNRLTAETDPLGHTTLYTYDASGNLLTTTDARGHTRSFTHDARGNTLSSIDALGNTSTYSYDASGNLTSQTDPLGHTTSSVFDPSGNRTRLTDALGLAVDFSYDVLGNLLSQVDAAGAAQGLSYDANSRPTSVGLAGSTRQIEYDAAGQVTRVRDAEGRATTFTYDVLGQTTGIVRPDAAIATQRSYDAEGNLLGDVSPTGAATTYTYDDADRLVRTTFSDGSTHERVYDEAGQLVSEIDALGRVTAYEYDAGGRVIRTVDAAGGVSTHSYDEVGNLLSESNPLGQTTSFEYDANGALVKTTFADGGQELRAYDAAGRLIEIVDPAGSVTAYGYDATGRLASVTDALGNVTSYESDDALRKAAIVDANGHRTEFFHDIHGRLVKTTFPEGETETRTYDASGDLASTTNGNGETVVYRLDGLRRLAAIELPDSSEESFTYTADGLLETVTDATGITRYAYDATTRRLLRVTEPDGRYVRYDYDAVGNRTIMAHAMGPASPEEITSYAYDVLDRLVTVTDPQGGITSYEYDAAGNQTRITRPNGTVTEQSFDARGRVVEVLHRAGATILARFRYTLDASGNRATEERDDGSRVEYAYDATGRVTAERHYDPSNTPTDTVTYAYDAVGNLLERDGSLGLVTAAYNANNQVIERDGVQFTYDAAGNLVTRDNGPADLTQYAYDARSRLVQVDPPGQGPTSYAYDYRGLRRSKSGPGGTVDFLSDRASPTGYEQVVRETDGGGSTLRSYVMGTSRLAQIEGGAIEQRHADALGSTRLITGAGGAAVAGFDYAAYGGVLRQSGSTSSAYRFAGEQQDPESQLYYLRARYYDTGVGAFLSRDPAQGDPTRPQSLHQYLYAHANPVNLIDPSGRAVPSSLAELISSLKIQFDRLREPLRNFVKAVQKAKAITGKVSTYLGAIFSVIALTEYFSDRAVAETYFGGKTGVFLQPAALLAEKRLFRTALEMLRKPAEFPEGLGCRLNEAAVYPSFQPPGGKTVRIILCGKFFSLTPLPLPSVNPLSDGHTTSMMGAMVHEWTHAIEKTDDFDYECNVVRAFTGAKAVKNADNYRCWVETSAVGFGKKTLESLLPP